MLPIKTIVCPVDFSDPSLAALDAAIEMARHFGAALKVLHVLPLSPPFPTDMLVIAADLHESDVERRQAAQGHIDEILGQSVSGVASVHSEVRMGSAPHEIICVANDDQADLIVIATHGRTGWRHLVFGSVAEAVVRGASCPVLTIHARPAAVAVESNHAAREKELAAL